MNKHSALIHTRDCDQHSMMLSTSTQKGCKSFGEASTGANMTACLRELKALYYCSFQVQGVCDLMRSKRCLAIVEKS